MLRRMAIDLLTILTATLGNFFPISGSSESPYKLSYPAGKGYKVTQGNFGDRSHNDPQDPRPNYAFDFNLFDGDAIVASRGGKILSVQDKFEKGKDDPRYRNLVNYVLIDHGDRTSALYLHLLKDSIVVKEGENIIQGQMIGKADSSGYISGAHLHFQVQVTPKNIWYDSSGGYNRGWYTQSIPISFSDADVLRQEKDGVPKQGKYYISDNILEPSKWAEEKILFVEDFWSVCAINSDGSGRTEIFPEILSKYKGDHSLYQLAISSDGTKIAFPIYGKLVNRFEESIAILETDTNKQRKIILFSPLSSSDSRTRMKVRLSGRGMDMKHLRWSPDKTRIVFEGVRGGSTGLYVLKLNKDVASLIRLEPVFPYFPSWSPDGNKIIFESYIYALEENPHYSKVCLVNADKSSEAQVIAKSYIRPEFSLDGKKIALLDSKWQLCIGSFESDRITDIKILVPEIEVKGMKWSPDGERIAFIAADRLKIYIINIDGNGLKEIFKNRIPIRELIGWVPNFPLR